MSIGTMLVTCPDLGADDEGTLDIVVTDRAGVEGPHLVTAFETARALYATADVQVVWHTRSTAPTRSSPFTLVLVASQNVALGPFGGLDTLGRVAQPGVRAYVLYDRVVAFARANQADPGVLLGQAMAHEIGHLLLGSEHSQSGLMAPRLDPFAPVIEPFSSEERLAIKARTQTILASPGRY